MYRKSIVIALAVVLLPAAGFAQRPTVPTGSWTGTLVPPNGQNLAVVVEVSSPGDSLAMTMRVLDFPDAPPVKYYDIKLSDAGVLEFTFDFLAQVSCVLKQNAASGDWKGECSPGEGNKGAFVLVPPKR